MATLADHVAQVRLRLAAACARAGRSPQDVTLVAATKTRAVAEIIELLDAGIRHLGENYVQEFLDKREPIDKARPGCVSWHLIGRLQRNKVKYVAGEVALVHSVDSLELAREIDRRAGARGLIQPVLLEVNLLGEATKSGMAPAEALPLAEQVLALPQVELRGLMTMPPYSEAAEDSRPLFRQLAELAAEGVRAGLPASALRELSMGMSGDFEVAVEEGATLIRLGTVLFGPRPRPA
ncbi:MAG TPA: YggS family pyridoxal phosphate-dependent enzyme [Armatimonadota bacterium]|jgi:hypothetical protein